MGRVKLKIRKLENSSGRQSTYSKRKNGLIKKANELSILCDIDISLLMFSPSGKPSLYKGQHSSIDKIIERYSRHTPQERAKRKLESLEALKKTFRKSDHDVKIRDFLGPSYISVEDFRSQAKSLKTQLSEVQKKLSNWTTLDKIESIEHLGQMEISLHTSLNQLQTRKANLRKQQMEIQVNEFLDNFHLPFTFGIAEQLQPLSWVPNDHSQHMVLSNNSNLIPLRDSDCSAGTSLESYSGLLNAGEKVQPDNFLTDLNRNGALSLQLNDQFNLQVHEQQSYPSYNFGLVNDGYIQPIEQMNTQENILDFLLDRKYEVPQSGYDPLHHSWVSASSGTCGSAMFEEHLFPQVHRSFDEQEVKELDHMFLKAAPHSSLIN